MKNLKKILAVVLALTVVLTAFSVFAEDKSAEIKVYEAKAVKFDNALKSNKNWALPAEKDIVFKNNKVTSNEADLTIFSYKEAYTNDLVQMDVAFNLVGDDGANKWAGVAVRSSASTAKVWNEGGNAYLFIVKHDRIELQRWNGSAQVVLAVVPNDGDIKDDEAASISVGAVDTDDGVNLFFFVDDKCLVNALDNSDRALKEGEAVAIYATEGTTVSKYTGTDKLPSLPIMPTVTENKEDGYSLSAAYSLVSFGEDAANDYEIGWYRSKYAIGENLTELQIDANAEFAGKYQVVGEYENLNIKGSEIEIDDKFGEEYVRACVVDAEGNILAGSTPYELDRALMRARRTDKIYDSSVILKLENCNAFVKGEKVQIDANDESIKPTTVSDRTLVPVRFVAESFGAEVGWEEETQKVTIKLDDKEIVMTLGEKLYTVNGEEKELDVPAQEMGGRTRVPVRLISETFGKTVFWDEYYELIIISGEDFGLDSDEDIEFIYSIVRKF